MAILFYLLRIGSLMVALLFYRFFLVPLRQYLEKIAFIWGGDEFIWGVLI